MFYEWHQYDPGVVPNLLHTGAGSPTGIIFYEGKLLPEAFRNRMIHCDALPRVVRAYPTQLDGAGYRAETQDILTTEDQWFRPVDRLRSSRRFAVCCGLERRRGRWSLHGRPESRNDDRADLPSCAPRQQTVRAEIEFRHANWMRRRFEIAQSLNPLSSLDKTPRPAGARAESSLLKVWKKSDDSHLRARALQLLARIPGREKRYLGEAMRDPDPDLRITSLRIARQLKLDMVPIVNSLAHDSSAQVRRECAIALRHKASPDAAKSWAELALQHNGQDRWYLEALGIGADGQWDQCLDAWMAKVGDQWNTPAGRDIVWRSRAKKTPALLVKIIGDKSLTEHEREHYFRSLDFISGPEKEAALLELLTAK